MARLPPVHLLLKETPSTLTEYRAWLLKVIDAWHEYMRRGCSAGVRDNWRVKLCNCVERAGLYGDLLGLHSLLGRRPSLMAHEPEAILRYLRLCQQTAEAANAKTVSRRLSPADVAESQPIARKLECFGRLLAIRVRANAVVSTCERLLTHGDSANTPEEVRALVAAIDSLRSAYKLLDDWHQRNDAWTVLDGLPADAARGTLADYFRALLLPPKWTETVVLVLVELRGALDDFEGAVHAPPTPAMLSQRLDQFRRAAGRLHEAIEDLGKLDPDAAAFLASWHEDRRAAALAPTQTVNVPRETAQRGRHGSGAAVAPDTSAKTPKRRGRPKADYETIQREAQLASDWKRARESGIYKADFAKGRGMTMKELEDLLDRVSHRNKRSDK